MLAQTRRAEPWPRGLELELTHEEPREQPDTAEDRGGSRSGGCRVAALICNSVAKRNLIEDVPTKLCLNVAGAVAAVLRRS